MEENTSIIQAYNINDEKVYPKVLTDCIEYTPEKSTDTLYGGDAIGACLAGKKLVVGDLVIDSSYMSGNNISSFVNVNTSSEEEKAELNIDIARINTTGNRGSLNINSGNYKQNCDLTAYFADASITNSGNLTITAKKTNISGEVSLDGSLHINGNLLPLETDVYNLGSEDKAWGVIHANSVYGDTIYFGDTVEKEYIKEVSDGSLKFKSDNLLMDGSVVVKPYFRVNGQALITGDVSTRGGLTAYTYLYTKGDFKNNANSTVINFKSGTYNEGNIIDSNATPKKHKRIDTILDTSSAILNGKTYTNGISSFRIERIDSSVYNYNWVDVNTLKLFEVCSYGDKTQINMKADTITIDGSTTIRGVSYCINPSDGYSYRGAGIVIGNNVSNCGVPGITQEDDSSIVGYSQIEFDFWSALPKEEDNASEYHSPTLYIDASYGEYREPLLNFRTKDVSILCFRTEVGVIADFYATGNITTNSTCYARKGFYETSDIRKKNIKSELSLEKCYELVDKCQEVIYSLKDSPDKEYIGMIAQEVEEVFPEVVMEDSDGFKSLDYSKMVVVCFRLLKDIIDKGNFGISKK